MSATGAVIVAAVSIVAVAPAAGSQPRTEQFAFDSPAWSHDGERIALNGWTGRSTSDNEYLFVMNADGSDLHKIDTSGIVAPYPNFGVRIGSPTWSPDDKRIAFHAGPDGQGFDSIWVIGSNGAGLRRVVPYAEDPAWSPGGRRIAYSEASPESWPGHLIRVIRPDGSDDRIAAYPGNTDSQTYSGPTWSPDGERLAFAWWSFDHDSIGARRLVPSALDSDPNARGLGIISDYGATPKFLLLGRAVFQLAWSPTGREIAFVENDTISLINLRTKRVKRLQPGFSPTWSPDGKRIAFVRGAFYGGSIYVMNRDGSHARLLLQEG